MPKCCPKKISAGAPGTGRELTEAARAQQIRKKNAKAAMRDVSQSKLHVTVIPDNPVHTVTVEVRGPVLQADMDKDHDNVGFPSHCINPSS